MGEGEGGSALILSLCEGGIEINFCLMRRGNDLVLGHISPISQPPLQVIIAQSLSCKQFSLEREFALCLVSENKRKVLHGEPPGWYENLYMRIRTQFQL